MLEAKKDKMAKDFDGIERRQYVRLSKENSVRFRVLSDDKTTALTDWIEAKTQNISLGGMCINVIVLSDEIKNVLEKNRFIEIEMNLTPEDDKIHIDAERAYIKLIGEKKWESSTKLYEMGIQYVNPPPSVIEKIREYILKKYLEEYKEK